MAAEPIHDNLKIVVGKPLDERYGPYSSRGAALTYLESHRRHQGLVVGIITTIENVPIIQEYIFRDGILDEHLILREANIEEGYGIKITEGANGAKVINARISTYRQQWLGPTSKKLVLEFTPTLVIGVFKDGELLRQDEDYYMLEGYTNVIQLVPVIMADSYLVVVYEHDRYAPLPEQLVFENPDVQPAGIVFYLVTADNFVSVEESSTIINVAGEVTGEYQAGDIISLNIGGNIFAGTISGAGRWSIPVPGSALINNTPTAVIYATAQLTQSTQDKLTVTGSHSYTRYTDAGGAPIPCATLDEVGGAGIRNIVMDTGSLAGLTGINYEILGGQVSISLFWDGNIVASVTNATMNGVLQFDKVTTTPAEVTISINSSDPTANWRITGMCPIQA